MCEYAGNNYYVLYDGMETILFKLEKLVSFSLNEAQRNSLAQVGIRIAEDGSFVDVAGNTCDIYLPYIFVSRHGSYRESPSAALSRFRLWQKNGLELEPFRDLESEGVHLCWFLQCRRKINSRMFTTGFYTSRCCITCIDNTRNIRQASCTHSSINHTFPTAFSRFKVNIINRFCF